MIHIVNFKTTDFLFIIFLISGGTILDEFSWVKKRRREFVVNVAPLWISLRQSQTEQRSINAKSMIIITTYYYYLNP